MKSILKNAVFMATLFALNIVHAQLKLTSEQLAAIESTPVTPASELPAVGTFYSAANPQLPPLPGNPLALQAWPLWRDTFLLDDLGASSGGSFHAMDDSEPPLPGSGGGGSGDFTNTVTPNFPTNGLWMLISNVADNTVYINIYGATDYVYSVWSSTNLSSGSNDWNVETEVFPGTNTNSAPFTISMNGRNELFLSAMDWTGVTANGNQTPQWWFYYWFGDAGLDLSDTNMDSLGQNTLLFDFQNGLDPDMIQFSISVTNEYVNDANAPIQVDVTAGEPFYFATLVDSTNFANATWTPYISSNITANLGSIQGWHDVWIGLRGFSTNATQTWQWQHLDLAFPPLLTITNPTTTVVDEPVIQIYGYCQEPLASICYDLSNAAGVFTHQPSEITDEYYDTNVLGLTTNYFECLDVPLTNGPNTVTMHATDLAGDATTTNFTFMLDYSDKTNPPVVQITWPQDGTEISGTNFTCIGSVSDPTATIAAQVVFTNGDTNFYASGIYTNVYTAGVDRNGNFSIENIPLQSGSNTFTISAIDVVGNESMTNITVVQTNFVLTINPVYPDSQLWQSTVNLTGTISDPNYAVWVNGVKGTNNGDGTWSANNVPVNCGGTANFTATGYAPNEQQPDGSYGN